LKSFGYATKPRKHARRSYSGFGSRMDLSAPSVAAGNIPHSHPQYMSVLELPLPDLCHGRNGHAPHTSAPDGMVLGNVSVCDR